LPKTIHVGVCMLDIDNLTIQDLDTVLTPVQDEHLSTLKKSWYHDPQESIGHDEFVNKASDWFRSTKIK